MQRTQTRLVIWLMLGSTLLSGCAIHRPTIREYRNEPGGQVSVSNVTEEQYWKERVEERIAAEIAKEKPEAGYDTWQNYWRWWYSVLRSKKKVPFKSDTFKTPQDMINYIKERRHARGLPTYEE